MKVLVAKTAGFCFGVNRAVETVKNLLSQGKRVATLGPIIHNPQVVSDFERQGVTIVGRPGDAQNGTTLVIRSHGIPEDVYDEIKAGGYDFVDATCPYVKKIHEITREAKKQGKYVLIAGDAEHPEVIGIKSCCSDCCGIFDNEISLTKLLKSDKISGHKGVVAVAQTTFDTKKWFECVKIIKKVCTNAEIFDTICNATFKRQSEAQSLAEKCDYMIIVGGRHSSNTKKLYDLCSGYCEVSLIEQAGELDRDRLKAASCIGLTAGASTPAWIIKEVQNLMSEVLENTTIPEEDSSKNNTEPVATAEETVDTNTVAAEPPAQSDEQPVKSFDEMTDEEAFEYSLNNMSTDQKVKGIVLGITPTEIQVDIGRKHAGYIPLDEYSYDPTADPKKELKLGDEIDLIVMKTNDQEGTVMLSKKRFDAIKNREKFYAAAESGEVLNGHVIEIIKGGVIVMCDGVQVFVPASQATLSREEPIEDLLHKPVTFKILELNKGRRRSVGSIRATLQDARREQRAAQRAEFWANVEEGKVYTGKVKSITSYGAFVDLGGVDGMVHISELSWKRIKNPTEVVNVGDVIEVYVKSFDTEKHKVSLGYKKAEDNPWNIFLRDYKVGDVIDVKIVSMTTYGAFANIIDGVDGLIHISQIADRRIEKPQDVLKVGETVKAKITAVDEDRKRVSLSIRALIEDSGEESAEEAAADDAAAETEQDAE